MVHKEQLQIYFEKIKSKEITVKNVAITLGCSMNYLSILYKRYKNCFVIHFDLLKEDEYSIIQPQALKELNIRLINSKPYQPQGKGKVERKFLTFQKQLPFFLKLRKAQNIEQVNEILKEYVNKHNTTYSSAIKDTF
ncbi:MAG: hypothetical protein WH035_02300 [Spirochaetota bacterium]